MQTLRIAAVGLKSGAVPEVFAASETMSLPQTMDRAKQMRKRWGDAAAWHGVFQIVLGRPGDPGFGLIFSLDKPLVAALAGYLIQEELEPDDGQQGKPVAVVGPRPEC